MSYRDKRKVVINFGQLNKIENLRVFIENLDKSEVNIESVIIFANGVAF